MRLQLLFFVGEPVHHPRLHSLPAQLRTTLHGDVLVAPVGVVQHGQLHAAAAGVEHVGGAPVAVRLGVEHVGRAPQRLVHAALAHGDGALFTSAQAALAQMHKQLAAAAGAPTRARGVDQRRGLAINK